MGESCGCGCRPGAITSVGAVGRAGRGRRPAPDETVETAVRGSDRAADVLRSLGIDTCCGGRLTLGQAAASAGVPVETVLAALDAVETEPA